MKISPIAEYLRINKAIPKHDKYGCHFISPEGLYLGRMTRTIINNYTVINLETFGEGFKKMFTKSIAFGQQFAYIKNIDSPLGLSLVPVRTIMRKIFVDFINSTKTIEDIEKTLSNKLDLIAIDKQTQTSIFDTKKPFEYKIDVNKSQQDKLVHSKFIYKKN